MTYQHALQYLAERESSGAPLLPLEALDQWIEKGAATPMIVCTSHDKQGSATALLLRSILSHAGISTLHLIDAPEYELRDRYVLDGKPLSPTALCAHAQDVRTQEIKLRRALSAQGQANAASTFSLPHRALAVLLRCAASPIRVILLEGTSTTPYLHALCDLFARLDAITLVSATDEGGKSALSCILPVTREVIAHPSGPALFRSYSDACVRTGSRLAIIAKTSHRRHSATLGGQMLDYTTLNNCRIRSGSALAADAAVLAIEAAFALRRAGFIISNEVIQTGLSQAALPMCASPISIQPLVITERADTPTELALVMRDLTALADVLPAPRHVIVDPHLASAFETYALFADTLSYGEMPPDQENTGCTLIIGSGEFVRKIYSVGVK